MKPARWPFSKKRTKMLLVLLDRALEAEHMARPPLRGQTSAALLRRMRRETDTGLVLVLTLWMEQALTDLLRAFLVRDARTRELLKSLGGRLDHKIALASALGVLWEDQRNDADLIKTIRNRFAHRVLSGTFADRDVAELVDRLHYARSHPNLSRRAVFMHSTDRLVHRARVAKRLVSDMHRGELSLRELRVILSAPTVQGPKQPSPTGAPADRNPRSSAAPQRARS